MSVPLVPHFKLSATMTPESEEEMEYMAQVLYVSVVGSLMYAMVCTRPDIAQAVSVVSRFLATPGKRHWNVVKWILRWLQGAKNKGLMYYKSERSIICGYVDSDYAGDLEKRRSITGYVFTLSGGPISLRSILQGVMALSTTKS